MTSQPPPDRHKFANDWDEIGYLYDKLLYWLYGRASHARARFYGSRLERLLCMADPTHEAILGEECRSLACEATKDIPGAIGYRKNEIRLIRKLQKSSRGKPYEKIALKGYGPNELSERLDLLALLYRANDELDQAVAALRDSKRLCEKHGIKFDGADILQECLDLTTQRTSLRA